MATIHPYKGYLNTEFHFYANGTEDILYDITSISGETERTIGSGKVTPNIPHPIKLDEAGSFRVDFNDGTSANITVEDGYKFGGSKHKKSFIFDDCPWSFVIMYDRTYFYNRETEDGYVESISPDEIEVVSKDYVILGNSTQEEKTIYSLANQTPILNVSNIIYHTEDAILWKENEEIILFSLKNRAYISRICPIQHLVDKENNQLLYAFEQTIFALNLFDDYQVKELYHWNGVFQAFVDDNITVYSSYKKQNRYLQVVNHNTQELVKEIVVEGNISSVNGQETIDLHERRQAIRNFDINKSEFPEATISACYHDFIFYPCDWDIYYLERITTFTKHSSHFDAKEECSLHSLNTDLNQKFNYLNNKTIITDIRFLIFNDNESFVRSKHYDAAGYNKGGNIHIHKDMIILEKDNYEHTLSRNGYWDHQITCNYRYSMFKKYGIVYDKGTGIYKSYFSNVKGQICIHSSNPVNHIVLGDSIILEGGEIYYKKSDLHKFSVNPLAVSPNMTLGITQEDGNIYLLDISSQEEVRKRILIDIFDASEYHDVILGQDGSQILYRNSKVTRITDIILGETFDFGNMSYVQHTNGIRAHFSHRAGSLQPRLVNPITGQMLDAKQMEQYDFISPDGRLYADTRLIEYIERYYIDTDEIISENEYNRLLDSLKFPSIEKKGSTEWEQVKQRCIDFVKKHFVFLNKTYPLLFKNDPSGEIGVQCVIGNTLNPNGKDLIDRVIATRGIAVIRNTSSEKEVARIQLGEPLSFLNYVSFSLDSRYVALAGYRSFSHGLFLVHDLFENKTLCRQDTSRAVWTTAFSAKGHLASYTSTPNTIYFDGDYNCVSNEDFWDHIISMRNFLTFSPNGELMALSNQGYVPADETMNWGHQPSTLVEIREASLNGQTLVGFDDLSNSGIEDNSVASVSFSNDNKRIMMVGNDGVVIIRNLHLEKYANK